MRGSCSPASISTTREPPTRVFMTTIPGCWLRNVRFSEDEDDDEHEDESR
jgi:hypothetical protein